MFTEILHHQVCSWGMHDDRVEDGPQALQMLYIAAAHGEPYDIVILDMHMPGMDGITLARAIQADSGIAGVRLVMLTSVSQDDDKEAVRQAGIGATLTKPVRQSELYNCLVAVISALGAGQTVNLAQPVTLLSEQAPLDAYVLLAEDNLVNLEVGQGMLESLGYQVDVVTDGRAAVEAWARTDYDLILIDCQMPIMNGLEATNCIRERGQVLPLHFPLSPPSVFPSLP